MKYSLLCVTGGSKTKYIMSSLDSSFALFKKKLEFN